MRDARGNELVVRGGILVVEDTPLRVRVRDSAVRIKPYRDQARLSEPGYVHSLPPAPAGKRYFGRDVENGEGKQMQIFFGAGEEDEEAEAIEPALEGGSYHAVSTYDGVHIYRDEGEEQLPPPANVGSAPITNMPSALAGLNAKTQDFWKRQLAGGAPNSSPPNAKAIAAAISAVTRDGGTTDASAMRMQTGLKALNYRNRAHYSGGQDRTHDAGPVKGPPTAAMINARNRAKWGAGRQ